MKTLIVTGHPCSKGFTHKIAKKLIEKRIKNGQLKKDVELLNLYDSEFSKHYVEFKDHPKEICEPKHIQKMQKKIMEIDELILIFPMWNLDCPAIVKNWYDSTFTARFAFAYNKYGVPHGLLTHLNAKVYVTCDGPGWYYKLSGSPTKKMWKKWRFGFCGMNTSFTLFSSMMKRSDEEREKILESL